MNQAQKYTTEVLINEFREALKVTTPGNWTQGRTTHHTVSERAGETPYYRIAEFHHANDAAFCDLAHNHLEQLLDDLAAANARTSVLEAQLSAIGAGGVEALRKPAQAVAVPESFFSYCDDDGFTKHDSLEAAKAASQDMIDILREEAGTDEWPGSVGSVCYGVIVGQSTELPGEQGPGGEETADYVLLAAAPAQDATQLAGQGQEPSPPLAVTGPVEWPATCDGMEQEAWEAWARVQRFDMSEHPMHYLFLNERTDAARQGWKGVLVYAVEQMKQRVHVVEAAPAQAHKDEQA